MKRSAFDDSQDQRVAREVGTSRALMCAANGCPNRWSTSEGHLCRWHAAVDPVQWPQVTQEQQWDETERARANSEPRRSATPLTREQKGEILAKLAGMRFGMIPGKAWADTLKAREHRGDVLTQAQRDMWRAALRPLAVVVPAIDAHVARAHLPLPEVA